MHAMAHDCRQTARRIDPGGSRGFTARYCRMLADKNLAAVDRMDTQLSKNRRSTARRAPSPELEQDRAELKRLRSERADLRRSTTDGGPVDVDAAERRMAELDEEIRELAVKVKIESGQSFGAKGAGGRRPASSKARAAGLEMRSGMVSEGDVDGITWDHLEGTTWDDIEGREWGNLGEIRQMRDQLAPLLERLTEKQRSYLLAYYGGMSMHDIAQKFGIDTSTVSRTIARANRKLKDGAAVMSDAFAAPPEAHWHSSAALHVDFRAMIARLPMSAVRRGSLELAAAGLSRHEIAAYYGVDASTVTHNLARGFRQLWEALPFCRQDDDLTEDILNQFSAQFHREADRFRTLFELE